MARERHQLTWHSHGRYWVKYRKGSYYRFGQGRYRNRKGSRRPGVDDPVYRACLEQWKGKLAELTRAEYEKTKVKNQAVVNWASPYDAMEFQPEPVPAGDPTNLDIDDAIRLYLAMRKAEALAGEISPKMYEQDGHKLNDFREFLIKQCRQSNLYHINEEILRLYREFQLHIVRGDSKTGHSLSPETVKKRLATVSRFLHWAYERGYLDKMPRNLNKNFTAIRIPKPKPLYWSRTQVSQMLDAATPRLKLYILLALNLGYTQKDIATLRNEHIDWPNRMVRRSRNKTGVAQWGKLWKETAMLLKSEKAGKKNNPLGLVLLGENGNPIVDENIVGDNVTITDSVRLRFNHLKIILGIKDNPRGFRNFRKTGANEIGKQFQAMPHLVTLYLAHTSRGVDHHYCDRHFDPLYEATDWLGKYYGLRVK